MIDRCWDVGRMRAVYRAHLEKFADLATDRTDDPAEDPARAFADYVAGLHEWRILPYVNPGLRTELLPRDWGPRPRHCSSRPVTCSSGGVASRREPS